MNYSDIPSLLRFWTFEEIINSTERSDVIDEIVGAVLNNIAIPQTPPCTSWTFTRQRAIPNQEGAFFENNKWVVDRDLGNCLQPDKSSGADSSLTTDHPNLGQDDFLFLVSGHSLSNNATGLKVGLGAPADVGGNVSFLGCYTTSSGNGVPNTDPVVCVRDTLGNVSIFTEPGQPWGFTQGSPDGSLYPYMLAIYRKDGQITRRMVQRHTGFENKESVSAANLTGDIHPNKSWFWYDQITYGAALFQFPNGAPDDIDAACDWMAKDWDDNFNNKTADSIWPSWAEDINMKFSEAPLKSTSLNGGENIGAGDAGSDAQLNPDRIKKYAKGQDYIMRHFWQCTETAGATVLVDSIAGADITLLRATTGVLGGYVIFDAPNFAESFNVGGPGLWQPGLSDFIFIGRIDVPIGEALSNSNLAIGDIGVSTNHQVNIGHGFVPSSLTGDGSPVSLQATSATDERSTTNAIIRKNARNKIYGRVLAVGDTTLRLRDGITADLYTSNEGSMNALADLVNLSIPKLAGLAVIEFPNGIPDDVESAIQWMGNRWATGDMSIWPDWNPVTA